MTADRTPRPRRAPTVASLLAAALALSTALPAHAQDAQNTPKAAAATPAASDLDTARADWDARPEAVRRAIQSGLLWTGDYTGAIDGTFGRMTFEAIRAFQTRHGFAADGMPTAPAIARLAETEKKKREAVGFALVDDAATGVRLGMPVKLLGKAAKAEGGTRWTSKDGKIDYRAYAVAKQDLAQLFERLKQEGPTHKVGYAVLRPDWFVITDTVGSKRGYARFERFGDGVRGFIVYSDPSVGADFDRVVLATASSFRPDFRTPDPRDAVAAPAAKPDTTATPDAAKIAPPVAAPVALFATGLLVAPGRAIVAAAAVDACREVKVAGRPVAVAGLDDAKTLALVSWAETGTVPPIRLAEAPPAPGEPEIVVMRGATGTTVVSGRATATGVGAALQRGGLSAPVVDASGRLVGLVADRPDESRSIAGVMPSADYRLIPAAALTDFVGKAGGGIEPPGPTQTLTSAGAVATLGARLVGVVCEK
jgi:peptidoglycan hydrolase-like protein with peptidoglycan-binding domain